MLSNAINNLIYFNVEVQPKSKDIFKSILSNTLSKFRLRKIELKSNEQIKQIGILILKNKFVQNSLKEAIIYINGTAFDEDLTILSLLLKCRVLEYFEVDIDKRKVKVRENEKIQEVVREIKNKFRTITQIRVNVSIK